MHPIETGNIVLILVGIGLVLGGGVICYRTVRGIAQAKKKDTKAVLGSVLNVAIGVVFVVAGVLFVWNNLRGNPLHLKP